MRAGCWGTAGMCLCTMRAGVHRVLDLPRCAWGVLVRGVSGLPRLRYASGESHGIVLSLGSS